LDSGAAKADGAVSKPTGITSAIVTAINRAALRGSSTSDLLGNFRFSFTTNPSTAHTAHFDQHNRKVKS
jgi:hypothetical protein